MIKAVTFIWLFNEARHYKYQNEIPALEVICD